MTFIQRLAAAEIFTHDQVAQEQSEDSQCGQRNDYRLREMASAPLFMLSADAKLNRVWKQFLRD